MLRIIAAGTFDRDFGRNRRLISLLRHAGHEVVLCQVDLYGAVKYDIVSAGKLSMLIRGAAAYVRLLWRFVRTPRADAVLVMYPGWFDMLVVGPVARLRRMPVVFDIYISLSDTIVVDRQLAKEHSVIGRLSRIVDWLSIRSARRLLADTPANADLYRRIGRIERERIGVVWVGAEDDVFRPRPEIAPHPRRVLFYGTFIKLHGVDVIVRAAKLLEAEGVEFRIIGTGQELAPVERLVAELDVTNIEFTPRVPLADLPSEIAAATVCCGIFGTSEKAQRVVPNKVFECVAVGRPVVTGDTPALRGAFSDAEIAFVPPGDPRALARVIAELLADPDQAEALAAAARRHYLADYATDSLSRMLEDEFLVAVQESRRRHRRRR
jgi:glycosyltransferase involved in cell wall biosynthesis